MRKQKRIPYESCIIIYFFLQLIYVYVNITVRRSRQSGVARATCPD